MDVEPEAPIFSLDAHASYACRHSGACCTAGWSIPVETHLQVLIGAEWLVPDEKGACPQYDSDSHLCRLHRDHGAAMLPESCHHFPRRALIDDRGIFVNLSHYCPTAAALLIDDDRPLSIVVNPPAFPSGRGYEGLDARGEWPPLARADLLFDWESFGAWQRYLVETLSGSELGVEASLARAAAVGELLREWTPALGSLSDRVRGAIRAADKVAGECAARRYASYSGPDAFVRAAQAVPLGLRAPSLLPNLADVDAAFVAPAWDRSVRAVLRYVAAHAFASWTAYQSRGVRTQIAELFMTAAVLRVECARACHDRQQPLDRDSLLEAVRASDLLLVHLADRDALMAWLGESESEVAAHATT